MKFIKIFSSLILFFLVLETISWVWIRSQEAHPPEKWRVEWKQLHPPDPHTKAGLEDIPPGSINSQTISFQDGKKTEIIYRINEYGLRGASPTKDKKKSHLLLSGDSFVFGQAVPENETISSYLAQIHPDIRVSNLGWPGGSMHTALRYFDLVNTREFSSEEKGELIYVFVNFHVYRWHHLPRSFRWATATIPRYQEVNGKIVYQGIMGQYWAWKFFKLIQYSSLGKILSDYLMDYGAYYKLEDVHSYLSAVQELKRRYLEIYPQGRFVILTHPIQEDYDFIPAVKAEAQRRGIECFDSIPEWKTLHPEEKKVYLVPGDGHPNSIVNEFLSRYITEKILSP